ncbi:MAG: hypothetical protein H6754_05060 [Candidatus Omnitrophica bacterium]|nr:hypothetical protein [Candidatus Omnitrophota bacterium]
MSHSHEATIASIIGIIQKMKLKHEVTNITYRTDYQDYQLLFGDTHHCEIQEKTINDVMVFKNGDALRQIQFLLNHLTAWQDWERPSQNDTPNEKISLDDE